MPGVTDLLGRLTCSVCVASNSGAARLKVSLEAARLYEHFAPNVFSAEMVERGKPAPDVFPLAANEMGASPHHCLVVEDSPAGVTAARLAGMRVFGFCGGTHCTKESGAQLVAAGAHGILDDLASLADIVFATVNST